MNRKWILSGIELRKIRLSLDLTVEELAEKLGCTRQFVGGMEIGKFPIPMVRIKQIKKLAGHTRAEGIVNAYARDLRAQMLQELGV